MTPLIFMNYELLHHNFPTVSYVDAGLGSTLYLYALQGVDGSVVSICVDRWKHVVDSIGLGEVENGLVAHE